MSRVVDTTSRRKGFPAPLKKVLSVVAALDLQRWAKCPKGMLSVVFVGDKEISQIHKTFMNDPSVTDVITFIGEAHPAEPFAGEIVINVDQARRAGPEHGQSAKSELLLYLVHGWLHLAGYRDKKPKEAKVMRAAEAKCVGYLSKRGIGL